jgi:outer membrane protein assembly factor BamB
MKNLFFISACLIFSLVIIGFNPASAQNSSGWRGSNGDGTVDGFKAPAKWPDQLKKVWQLNVGESDASPILVKGKIYLHSKTDTTETALCIDPVNGTEIWRTVLNSAPAITGPASGHPGPRSTPSLVNDKLFTLGVNGILTCIDTKSGKVLWENTAYTAEVPRFFTGSSSLILEGKCIVQLGGHEKGIVAAFDVNSGKELWKLESVPCTYSSPVVMKTIKNMILLYSETDLLGISPDGQLLWKIPAPAQRMFYNQSTPLYDGILVIMTGQGSGTKAFSLEKKDRNWEPKEVWTNAELGASFNTPVIKDGFLYGNEAKSGSLYCLNLKTGEKSWVSSTSLNRFATILDLGKVVFSLSANRQLTFFEPNGKEYIELAKYNLGDTDVYAAPIVSGNKIFIKDRDLLTCWSIE